jgi:putative hydrolase
MGITLNLRKTRKVGVMSIPFGFASGGDDNNELADMLENMGRMLRNGGDPSGGSVNWTSAHTASAQTLKQAGDPAINEADTEKLRAAADLADLWLNDATTIPSAGYTINGVTRDQWLASTFDSWKVVVQPVADAMAGVMTGMLPSGNEAGTINIPDELLSSLPDEVAANLRETLASPDFAAITGPLMAMAKSMGATMFGTQFGQALGQMTTEVLSNSDVGIPLNASGRPGLVISNANEFVKGLSIDESEARLYITLRELAHQRLFTAAPWIQSQLMAAITDYARGVKIDTSAIEQAMTQIDPTDPDSINNMMTSSLFEPTQTPEQIAALTRIELLLALIEGWVTVVVTQAAGTRLQSAGALEEVFRRRRGAGGPAEKVFGGLIGLEMRPRRMREAAALWQRLADTQGIAARDNLWSHPDLLPRDSDIDDIDAFLSAGTEDLMAELNKAIESSKEDPENNS